MPLDPQNKAQIRDRELRVWDLLLKGYEGVNTTQWLQLSATSVVEDRFLANGFEAGYVWDTHMVSVGSKQNAQTEKRRLVRARNELRRVSRTELWECAPEPRRQPSTGFGCIMPTHWMAT